MNGSVTQCIRRPSSLENSDQSKRRTQIRKQNSSEHSIQTFLLQKSSDSSNNSNFETRTPKMSKMDKTNRIDLQFILKYGDIPQKPADYEPNDSSSFNRIKPELWKKAETTSGYWNTAPRNKTGRNRETKLHVYNCESLRTTPLREFKENFHESWLNTSSDNESQTSHI